MDKIQRVIVIVLDGVGAGEAPDAAEYGDVGSNSLANTARAIGGLHLPNLEKLGLGKVTPILGLAADRPAAGAFGRMKPVSAGKDSISGHWELMGVALPSPLPTYPDGFPPEVIAEFTRSTGLEVLGNKPASGTEIIRELGLAHLHTGKPIVYTSADSVFQIAAHEEVIPLERLYEISRIARAMLTGKHAVGRVIARPFVGSSPETFQRTPHRRDFPLQPFAPTLMDHLIESGRTVLATGKIDDLFGGRGITRSAHSAVNAESLQSMLDFVQEDFTGLLFTNLVEFDMIYGHRNDPQGYARALYDFDCSLPALIEKMRPGDMAMIVADHGVDPTTPGTDHSRELIPLLVFGPRVRPDTNLGTRSTFSDVAATLADIFDLKAPSQGTSFLSEVI